MTMSEQTTEATGAELVEAEPAAELVVEAAQAEEPMRASANEGEDQVEGDELGAVDVVDAHLAALLAAPAARAPEVIVPEVISPPWLVAMARPRPWWASIIRFREDF